MKNFSYIDYPKFMLIPIKFRVCRDDIDSPSCERFCVPCPVQKEFQGKTVYIVGGIEGRGSDYLCHNAPHSRHARRCKGVQHRVYVHFDFAVGAGHVADVDG